MNVNSRLRKNYIVIKLVTAVENVSQLDLIASDSDFVILPPNGFKMEDCSFFVINGMIKFTTLVCYLNFLGISNF